MRKERKQCGFMQIINGKLSELSFGKSSFLSVDVRGRVSPGGGAKRPFEAVSISSQLFVSPIRYEPREKSLFFSNIAPNLTINQPKRIWPGLIEDLNEQ